MNNNEQQHSPQSSSKSGTKAELRHQISSLMNPQTAGLRLQNLPSTSVGGGTFTSENGPDKGGQWQEV